MSDPLLAFDRVGRTYWRGLVEIPVLDEVTFEIGEGEFAAIAGRQAAGKTTLLRIAAGLDAPDRGTVRLRGRDLYPEGRPPRLGGLPRSIGWLQRSRPQIPSMRMYDYVAFPLLEECPYTTARRRAMRALDRFGAAPHAEATWGELSDAQRTQIMLARATVREPALLLADDPTAGLNVHDREALLGLLHRAAETTGMATLIAVPEIAKMLRSHYVMPLKNGKLMQRHAHEFGDVIDFPSERSTGL